MVGLFCSERSFMIYERNLLSTHSNAHMLIFIDKITELPNFRTFRENSGKFCISDFPTKFRMFRSGTFGKSIRNVWAIIIINFRLVGCIVHRETEWVQSLPSPSIFPTSQRPSGNRVRASFSCYTYSYISNMGKIVWIYCTITTITITVLLYIFTKRNRVGSVSDSFGSFFYPMGICVLILKQP